MTTKVSSGKRRFIPQSVGRKDIYHDDWIDFNKNGKMDPFENPRLPVAERVDDLIRRMALEEKVAQLQASRELGEHGVGNLTHVTRDLPPREGAEKANEYQVRSIENTRLGIPVIIHDECLHGCVAKLSTSFPQAIGLAATFDADLMYEVSKVIANETRSRGIRQCLSPVVNIVRDVRAGRTEESFGEDPFLTSIMGSIFCKAMREEGVVATPKHYAANFVGDGGRDSNEIHLSERILREVFLPGFEACVRAGALSIMPAYNSIDGVPCSCNKWLLTDILRKEWGFEGFAVSDYGSVTGILQNHHVCGSPEEAAKLALEAGMDVELPFTNIYGEPLLQAIKKGLIAEETVDAAVRNVLRAKFLIGLFEDPFVDPEEAHKTCNCEKHAKVALEAERKAIVLLKNEGGMLPLDKGKMKSIAVIGPLSDEVKLGGYSGVPPRLVTVLEGIKRIARPGTKVLHAKGCPIVVGKHPIPSECLVPPNAEPGQHGLRGEYFNNPDLSGEPVHVRTDSQIDFDWGYGSPDPRIHVDHFSVRWAGKLAPPETRHYEISLSTDDGVRFWLDGQLLVDAWRARSLTTDVFRVKLEAGRQYDVKLEYFEHVATAIAQLSWDLKGKPPTGVSEAARLASGCDVAVIAVGVIEGEGMDRAGLELPGAQEELIEAILETGMPTIVVLMTGSAVTGEWIKRVPAIVQAWYPGQEGGTAIAEVLFGEQNPGGRLPFTWPRYVGQLPLYYNHKPTGRGYNYVDMSGDPLFPFGHGLSYTRFEYSNFRISVKDLEGKVDVDFDVRNIGDRDGEEVVQLYIHDPVGSVARPVKELKRFKRPRLRPKESVAINFALTSADLSLLDQALRRDVEPGDFEVIVGASSADVRLRKTFTLTEGFRASS